MLNLRSTMKGLSLIQKSVIVSLSNFNKFYSANADKIIIPTKIQRSPTDILLALSSTVNKDPTAAHYKFHDDPYLIPSSNIGKRTFAMAQEAGRKSAKWIRQENSKLFQHKVAEPPVDAFIPTKIFTEESTVELTDLNNLIKDVEVADAVLVYKLLQKNGVEISSEVKQNLLELLCFYNQDETLHEELIEERWFRQGTRSKERQRKTWKDNELADELFAEIEPKDSKVYSAMIRGMCKYFQVEKAWALYNESLAKNIELDVQSFNAILTVVSFIRESNDLKWDLIQELLIAMKNQKIQPNLGTLNSALQGVSTIGAYRQSKDYALKILAEFKKIGIEPSLASWYYILIIFCKERGPVSHVLVDIMNQIENKEFKIQDLKDCFFFVTAMDVCRNHLHDKVLAKRVDALLHLGENYNLIGDSYKESIYYRHFFSLLCSTEPLDTFMETYHRLVPNVYIPEPGVMEDILKSIEVNGAINYIPQIFSHMIIFDMVNREGLLTHILRIMITNRPDPTNLSEQDLNDHFGRIAYEIFTKIEEQNETRTMKTSWSGKILGDILTLLCRVSDFEKADLLFTKLEKDQHKILGEPHVDCLKDFVNLCIEMKHPTKAINCLQYCVEIGMHESKDIARNICRGFTLDEKATSKVCSLVGHDFIQEINSQFKKD